MNNLVSVTRRLQCWKSIFLTYNFTWLGYRCHLDFIYLLLTFERKVLVILNSNSWRGEPDKKVNTHRRQNKQDCHLGHSHRACVQFWNALISLISTFPHSIILGRKRQLSEVGRYIRNTMEKQFLSASTSTMKQEDGFSKALWLYIFILFLLKFSSGGLCTEF